MSDRRYAVCGRRVFGATSDHATGRTPTVGVAHDRFADFAAASR